ncbi:hypothetical protein KFE98_03115 [bacterium SCSIO 12741]|nr:hypothetical protein KFE98_03115 [bacterium SCSIO 12741]
MNSKIWFYSFTLLALVGAFSACKKDEEEPEPETTHTHVHEEEVITTVELHLTKSDSTAKESEFTWSDADGPGGNEPSIDTVFLDSSSVYKSDLHFGDESDGHGHAHDVTHELEEEADEHLICFDPMDKLAQSLQVTRTDSDGKYEVGLKSEWKTSGASTGKIKITLKHQPGVKDGSCSPGETDIEIEFPVVIK